MARRGGPNEMDDRPLKYAEFLPHDARFPIILPRKNCVTKLIVKHYHEKDDHVGSRFNEWNESFAGGFINTFLDHFCS